MRAALVLSVALLTALLLAPSADAARWFGAKLSRSANSQATCQDFSFFYTVPSCSWATAGALFNPRESTVVPGTGVVTRVRIKVGNKTGPMRVIVAEALRKKNGGESACCRGKRQTKVLRPKRNGIRTFKVRLPVRVKYNKKSKIWAYDNLFLTMENANTVIPAHGGGNNCSGGWFPALRPGQENYSGPYGQCGYTILLRAKWRKR